MGEAGVSRAGSGLGLSIVREIVRLHGAAVVLGNTPGGGLTVALHFPPAGGGEGKGEGKTS